MATSKKQIEKWQLEKFISRMPSVRLDDVIPSEEPDFLAWVGNSVIGIELTELHRQCAPGAIPQQATEAMKRRVVARAQEIYAAKAMPPIRCAVLMNDEHLSKADVEPLANSIVEIAVRNMPKRNSSAREEYMWTNRDYFPERIHSVHVHRHDVVSYNHFLCPVATWVGRLTAEDIIRAIAPKEPKYEKYREKCDEAWLVINAPLLKFEWVDGVMAVS